jgi:hypothetical protein
MIVLAEEAGAYELMETSLFPDLRAILAEATTAFAAERDRADRAEAALDETNALIEGVVQALEEEPEACDAGSIIAALNIRLRFDAIRESEATA